jgi:Tol biopolymer transport system component
MDIDGSQLKQLTNGQEDYYPKISPDGQWVLFSSWRSGRLGLWRMPVGGGEPMPITDKFTTQGSYSPDGKLIACYYRSEQPDKPVQILILPTQGGEPVKAFDIPPTVPREGTLRWSPDGSAIVYLDSRSGQQNIWSQNLDGSPPKQLTDFKDNGVRAFSFSSDGKRLAMVRFSFRSDVVLIRDFR